MLQQIKLSALTLSLACTPAIEIHGGTGPKPAPSEAIWVSGGVGLDAGLQLAHVKPAIRFPLVIGTGVVLRNVCTRKNCRYFGRTVDSGFLFVISASAYEIVSSFVRAIK